MIFKITTFKKVFSCCFGLILTFSLQAQNPIDYVPDGATVVFRMNPKSLDKKVDLETLMKMDFFDTFLQQMTMASNPEDSDKLYEALRNPSKYGMDLMHESYFVMDMSKEGSFFSYIFKLDQEKKFTYFLKNTLTEGETAVEKKGDFLEANLSSLGNIVWNKDVVIMTSGDVEYEFEEYTEEEFEAQEKLQKEGVQNFAAQLISKAKPSIKNNVKYAKSNGKSDMDLWMDYGYIQRMGLNDTPMPIPGLEGLNSMMDSMYTDSYMTMAMNFNSGAIDMNVNSFMSDEMANMTKGMYESTFNPKLLRYINGTDLMGMISFNYNVENTVKAFQDMLPPDLVGGNMMDSVSMMMEQMLGISMTEQEMYDLWQGDMVMTFNGLQEFQKEMITYDYDDDFNPIEKKEMVTQQLPEFTMLMSTKNEPAWEKFFELGEQMGAIQKKGKYYSMAVPDMPFDVHLGMENGAMVMTNNNDLVRKRLKKGFKRKNRIDKSYLNLLQNNASAFVWDINKTLDVVSTLGLPMDFTGTQIMNASKNTFDSIIATNSRQIINNTATGNLSFNMVNKNQNSLEQFFNFINDIYISQMGGRSM